MIQRGRKKPKRRDLEAILDTPRRNPEAMVEWERSPVAGGCASEEKG